MLGVYIVQFRHYVRISTTYVLVDPHSVRVLAVVLTNQDKVSFAYCDGKECWKRRDEFIRVMTDTGYSYRTYCYCDKHGGRAREEVELLNFLEVHGAVRVEAGEEVRDGAA